jgi:hypothetical protein
MGFPSFVMGEFHGIATCRIQPSRKLEQGKADRPEAAARQIHYSILICQIVFRFGGARLRSGVSRSYTGQTQNALYKPHV